MNGRRLGRPAPGDAQNQEAPKKHERDAAAKEPHHNDGRSTQKVRARAANAATKPTTAADRRTVAILRDVHTKLEEADADYRGHRIRAMEHIGAAVHRLGSESVLNANLIEGMGNLPQARSDEILRNAIAQLRIAERNLGSGTESLEHHRGAPRLGRRGDRRTERGAANPLNLTCPGRSGRESSRVNAQQRAITCTDSTRTRRSRDSAVVLTPRFGSREAFSIHKL